MRPPRRRTPDKGASGFYNREQTRIQQGVLLLVFFSAGIGGYDADKRTGYCLDTFAKKMQFRYFFLESMEMAKSLSRVISRHSVPDVEHGVSEAIA